MQIDKGPNMTAKIYFHDIGDYLTREQKLEKIREFGSIAGITAQNGWRVITPDKHHDWINLRDDSFSEHISMGDKKDKDSISIFENYSRGLETARDPWIYNSSKQALLKNIKNTADFYNCEMDRLSAMMKKSSKTTKIEEFIDTDPTKISWSSSLISNLQRLRKIDFKSVGIVTSVYRPFTKQWVYFDGMLNHRIGQMPRIFPDATAQNIVMSITGLGTPKNFTLIMVDSIPDIQLMPNGQCFPLYLYDTEEIGDSTNDGDLFTSTNTSNSSAPPRDKSASQRSCRDAITDAGLAHFQKKYPKEKITKEDLFYYIYGLLHSPEYREKYADNLSKELPRIPAVKTAADFRAFEKAGRDLARLHVDYEKVDLYPVELVTSPDKKKFSDQDFYVTQMRYAKNGKEKDLSTVIYNDHITIKGIPLEAYEYVVNGKPALDWIIERYCVKTDKDSGIVNDANLWATETEKNPKYILELFCRVITVSLETMKIVKGLPGVGL